MECPALNLIKIFQNKSSSKEIKKPSNFIVRNYVQNINSNKNGNYNISFNDNINRNGNNNNHKTENNDNYVTRC
jgi:hypothetical protein